MHGERSHYETLLGRVGVGPHLIEKGVPTERV